MIIEIFLFFILRLTFLIIINEDQKYKFKYPLYTYYVSLIYQLFILPILCMLYYFNIIDIHLIFNFSIAYFVSDIIQLIFLNDINLLFHHVLSIISIYISKFIHVDLLNYSLYNIITLELGSALLSLPIIFKYKFLYKIRTTLYFISRVFALYNTYIFLNQDKLEYSEYIFFKYLSFFILFHNSFLLNYLIIKDIKYIRKNN